MRTLFQDCTHRTGKRTLLVSIGVHGLVLGALVVLPLISYAALPDIRLVSYLSSPALTESPPPPAPDPAPSPAGPTEMEPPARIILPREVPDEIPPPVTTPPSVIGRLTEGPGPPAGLPSGTIGMAGVPLEVHGVRLPDPPRPAPPQPVPPRPQQLRVSEGIVLSKAIRKVRPSYPLLAKNTRVEGIVRLDITIDEQGNVSEIQVMKGHPLLIQAAKDAVAQWKFSPTLLNEQPVKVRATISVVFTLN